MGFDAQWDGWFHWEVHRLVAGTDGDLSRLAEAMRFRDDGDPFRRVIYTESHDTTGALNDHVRLPQEIDPADPGSLEARKRSTLAAALLMTTPGVPMLLQGQELLQAGAFEDDAPLDWSSLERRAGIVQLYTDLIALRRDLSGRTGGLRGANITVDQVDAGRGVIAFRRWDRGGRGDDVVVVANFGDRAVAALTLGFPACGAWRVRFDSDRRDYSDDFGGGGPTDVDAGSIPHGGLPCSATLPLAPFSAVVLSQDP
jgi:1,4-alpha-glucan branching enzyme